MAKVSLTDITGGYQSVAVYNANNQLIEDEFDNCLSRDGTAPNSMAANIDMNSNKVTNLADGTNAQDAVTVAQLNAASVVASTAAASAVTVADAGGLLAADTVEGALAEIAAEVDANTAQVATNVADIETNTTDVATNTAAIAVLDADNARRQQWYFQPKQLGSTTTFSDCSLTNEDGTITDITLEAGASYIIRFHAIINTANATPDAEFQFLPAGGLTWTYYTYDSRVYSESTNALTDVDMTYSSASTVGPVTITMAAANSNHAIKFEGMFRVNAGGTISVQFRPKTATAETKGIRTGYFEVLKVS